MSEFLEWFKWLDTIVVDWQSDNQVMLTAISVACLGMFVSTILSGRAAKDIEDAANRSEWINGVVGEDQIEINTRQTRRGITGIISILKITNIILGGILAILVYSVVK